MENEYINHGVIFLSPFTRFQISNEIRIDNWKIKIRTIKRRPCGFELAKPGTREIAHERIPARTVSRLSNEDNRRRIMERDSTLIYH